MRKIIFVIVSVLFHLIAKDLSGQACYMALEGLDCQLDNTNVLVVSFAKGSNVVSTDAANASDRISDWSELDLPNGQFQFNLQELNDKSPLRAGDLIVINVTIKSTSSCMAGATGTKSLTYDGSGFLFDPEDMDMMMAHITLKLPEPTIRVTGTSLCAGDAGKTVTATLTNVPAGCTIDWDEGKGNITTAGTIAAGATSATGNIGTGLTATASNIRATLKNASGTVVATSNAYTVTVNPIPTATITTEPASGEVCMGSSLKVNGGVTGATGTPTWAWEYSGNGTKNIQNLSFSSVSGTAATNYKLRVTVNGCTSEQVSKDITILPFPTASLTAAQDSKCAGTTVRLTASASGGSGTGYTYTWTPASLSGANPEPTLAAGNNNYSVTVRDSKGCTSAAASKAVTGYTVTATLKADPASVHNGGASTLTVTPSGGSTPYQYTWSGVTVSGNTATATATDLSTNTTFGVVVRDATGCTSTKAEVTVQVTGGAFNINPADKTICSASLPSALNAGAGGGSGSFDYAWEAPAGVNLSSTTNAAPDVLATSTPGTHTVKVTVTDKGTGAKKEGTLQLVIKQSPKLSDVSADPATIFIGQTSDLKATVDPSTSSLEWSGGPLATTTGTNVTTGSLNSTTTYTVKATNDDCEATATVKVTINGSSLAVAPPTTTPSGYIDTPFDAKVIASGGAGGYTYTWTATDPTVTVTDKGDGTVSITSTTVGTKEICVKVTSGAESKDQCFNVIVTDPSKVGLVMSVDKKCAYEGEFLTIEIIGMGADTYSFTLRDQSNNVVMTVSDKASWDTYKVYTTAAGTYKITDFKYKISGVQSDGDVVPPVTAMFDPVPNVKAQVDELEEIAHCEGELLTLKGYGDPGLDYTWDNGVTDGVPFEITASGAYTVTGTDPTTGCFKTSTVNVSLNPKPSIEIPQTQEICAGDLVTLTATGGDDVVEIKWSNNVVNGEPFKPDFTATYEVTATNEAGCVVTDTTKVIVNKAPEIISHSKNPRNIAIGKDVSFAVKAEGNNLTYQWQRKQGEEWVDLLDVTNSAPIILGSQSDSISLLTVPQSWDESELRVIVSGDCGQDSMEFQLGVKECFEITAELVMMDGIIPDENPNSEVDGWFCRGQQISLKTIITSVEGYDIESPRYRWTIDGLNFSEEHSELPDNWDEERGDSILTWIPGFTEDDITVIVYAYCDGACEEFKTRRLKLKAREFEKVSLSLLTSVDPDHRFCPGDTVDFWVVAKNVGDSARFDWYNDIFHLPTATSPRNELLSYSDMKVSLVMGQEDTWMRVVATPSKEVCTELPEYVDTLFLGKKPWVTPGLQIINNIEDTMACMGDKILFTAVYENAGTNPTFNWRKDVWDWGHSQFVEATLEDKDMWLKCWLIPGNDVCYDGSLLVDSMVIRVLENPTVTISTDLKDKGPGDEIIIESEVVGMPTNAHYTWYLNYEYVLNDNDYPEYISDKLAQGDVIICGVRGDRICTSEVLSNELAISFGERGRDTVITIYQGEKIHNLNMRREGDTNNKIFRITTDGYPRWGVGSMNFNGYFDYAPNTGFVGSEVVKYEVVDKFDQTKVETGYIYISVLARERFFIPNIITPNGDGLNDTWQLDFLADYPDHYIRVYNREGKVVFEAKNYQNDWDGTGKATSGYVSHFNLPNGVYTYVIDLGNKEILKNWLEIRRDMNRGKYKY